MTSGGGVGTPGPGVGALGTLLHAAINAAKESAAPVFKLGLSRARADDCVVMVKLPSEFRAGARAGAGETNGDRQASPPLEAGLYVVATPIGNLRDISLRALDILGGVDRAYAEDTRVARKLLDAYGLKPQLSVYNDHSGEEVRAQILAALGQGQSIALLSDAGTPLVSDPGYKLVRAVIEAGHRVFPIPGASALLAGLVVSGLPSDRFLFAGFLPPKQGARRAALDALADIDTTLIFFESGPRLAESLADMGAALGERQAVVARELTKMFEETRRASLSELADHYAAAGAPKGEIVVIVAPPAPRGEVSDEALDAFLAAALSRGVKEAASEAARDLGVSRKRAYARALELKSKT